MILYVFKIPARLQSEDCSILAPLCACCQFNPDQSMLYDMLGRSFDLSCQAFVNLLMSFLSISMFTPTLWCYLNETQNFAALIHMILSRRISTVLPQQPFAYPQSLLLQLQRLNGCCVSWVWALLASSCQRDVSD